MSKENEFIAGKNAAVEDIKNKTSRDVSIYPSKYYQDGYTYYMTKSTVKEKKNVIKGGK